jgi:hypothetical protein
MAIDTTGEHEFVACIDRARTIRQALGERDDTTLLDPHVAAQRVASSNNRAVVNNEIQQSPHHKSI